MGGCVSVWHDRPEWYWTAGSQHLAQTLQAAAGVEPASFRLDAEWFLWSKFKIMSKHSRTSILYRIFRSDLSIYTWLLTSDLSFRITKVVGNKNKTSKPNNKVINTYMNKLNSKRHIRKQYCMIFTWWRSEDWNVNKWVQVIDSDSYVPSLKTVTEERFEILSRTEKDTYFITYLYYWSSFSSGTKLEKTHEKLNHLWTIYKITEFKY